MAAPSVLPDAASRKGSSDRVGELLLLVGAALVAFLLYRPDTNAPFEIIDFSETLPILTDGQGFGERFRGLVQYYLQHGRAAFGLSAGLAARWTLFEWWTPGWQWTRFVVGLAVVVLAWRLLRTLGANRTGATVGASLFIVSETMAPGWLRPSLNEPFGTLLLISASLLACRYQSSVKPARLAAGIALLLAAMIVVKETLIAATFFPVAIALCRGPDGLLGQPARSPRNVTLLVSSLVAILLASTPVLWAITRSATEGYARQFGATDSILSNAVFGVLPALVPFTPVSQPPGWPATVADVAWLVLLMAGLRISRTNPALKQHARTLLLLALALPLARLLVYLPWPLQFPYYSIPFLLGVAIVAAMGGTRLSESRGAGRVLSILLPAIVILYAAASASAQASRYFALRRLTDGMVSELHAMSRAGGLDSIVIAVPRAKEQMWWGLGSTLSRYAAATGRELPVVHESMCAEAESMMRSLPPRVALAALQHQCALREISTSGPREAARRFDFTRFRFVTDSLRAQIIAPPQ